MIFADRPLRRTLFMLAAALVLLLGMDAGTKAYADDFARNNSVLLDPFDPVPQIRFNHCDDGCGERHCYDGCGYRRHCERDCGYRYGWRCEHDCSDRPPCGRDCRIGYRCERDCGDYDRDHCFRDCHIGWHCERDCGPNPANFEHEWWDRVHRYDHQADEWQSAMEDYAWSNFGGRWRYWHDHSWHDDGESGRWHDGHHDGGAHEHHGDYEWDQHEGHWRYWHGDHWNDDGADGHWHDGHH